ncbi:hypothetical protein DW036_15700 [Bacteroides sp. AF39-11AC]|nr:hypothetical protein DW036_15700 [Bacteroides sp. AF39-11AC]
MPNGGGRGKIRFAAYAGTGSTVILMHFQVIQSVRSIGEIRAGADTGAKARLEGGNAPFEASPEREPGTGARNGSPEREPGTGV